MNPNVLFAEQANVVSKVPLDLATTGGLASGWVSMKNYHRATVKVTVAAGGAAEPPVITLQQATAVAGTSAKDATIITRFHKKEHATALSGVGTWTEVTQAAGATVTGTAEQQGIYMFDVRAEDLDVDGGFDCIQASVADVGSTAKLGNVEVILWAPRYSPQLTATAN